MKTKFNDLSGWLKLAVIGGWIAFGYLVCAFAVGFIYSLLFL